MLNKQFFILLFFITLFLFVRTFINKYISILGICYNILK